MSWMYRLIQRETDETSLTLDSSVKHLYWGSTGTPCPINTADDKGVALYFSSTATSGTTYGEYVRLDQKGASGEFIAGRFKTLLTVASAANAHGLHATTETDTSAGNVTGLCTGVRGNVVLANRAIAAGTYYGVMGEIYANGASSDVPASSNACLCASLAGTATALDSTGNAISFAGTDGSGKMIYTNADSDAAAGSIRILVNNAVKYLRFYAAQA